MNKIYLFIIVLILISGYTKEINKVCFEKNCFEVEIADSEEERNIGLMNRTFLGYDKGMLFIFKNEDIHDFWMKDTLISLDIIWINSNFDVVFIKENALPQTFNKSLIKEPFYEKASPKNDELLAKSLNKEYQIFTPNQKAKYVLEVNSGIIKRNNISLMDKVKIY